MDSPNKDLMPNADNIPRVKEIYINDVVFIIHCYRYAAKSDFFHALLFHNFAEKNQKKIEIRGIDPEIFEKVTQLLNTGTVECTLDNALEIYSACRYLLVKDCYLEELKSFIVDHFENYDVIELFEYCFANTDPLLDSMKSYIAPRIEALYHSESFQMLSLEAMLDLVTDGRVKITNEDSLCWIVAEWLVCDHERQIHAARILHRLVPAKFGKGTTVDLGLSKEYWDSKTIADSFWYLIFEYKPKIVRPIKSEYFKNDEPLYVSNEGGLLVATHFEGTEWSWLNGPRTPMEPSTFISAAARKQADLYVATWEIDAQFNFQTMITNYNFRNQKVVEMRQARFTEEIKGLNVLNQKLFANTKSTVQQYCSEHDLWLNPINIGLKYYEFSASDGEYLYVCGHYEWSGKNSVHLYDPRAPEWIYLADTPDDDQSTCGTFIDGDLYMISLGQNVRLWNIRKLDVRNVEWTLVTSHWSRSWATPVSIRQCKKDLVVMDHHRNTFMGPNVQNGKLNFIDHYAYSLKPVFSLD